MQNLLIEQRSPSGLMKRWRLRADQTTVTFGSSKHADMRTSSDTIRGIQGVFEYRNNCWYYINLDLNSNLAEFQNSAEICLDKTTDLNIGVSTLTITPLDLKAPVLSKIEQTEAVQPGSGKSPFQIYCVYQGTQLVESKIIPINEKFISKFDPAKTKFTPLKSDSWKKTNVGDIEVNERTVYLNSINDIKRTSGRDLIDDSGKKSLYATLGGCALLTFIFLLQPKPQTVEDVLVPIPPPQVREMKMEPVKPKQQAQKAPQQTSEQPQQAAANNSGGGSRAASAIKSLASGRITQLVGKVSANAKSSHIVITSGKEVGTAPTGRALAAIGSLSKSGKDWSSEGKAGGVSISTKGKAGGQGTQGMATLAAGKTGSGGAELLEQEGEIVGGLDREIIAAYIRSQLGQILYCYERQLSANPDLYGKVAVKFTIVADGTVETQRIGDTTLKNATVEGCILQRVARWKFPAPEGGTKVLVTYPFLFKSTN